MDHEAAAVQTGAHDGRRADDDDDPDRREDVARSVMTALHWAASNQHLAVVRALLDRGATLDIVDSANHLCDGLTDARG